MTPRRASNRWMASRMNTSTSAAAASLLSPRNSSSWRTAGERYCTHVDVTDTIKFVMQFKLLQFTYTKGPTQNWSDERLKCAELESVSMQNTHKLLVGDTILWANQ